MSKQKNIRFKKSAIDFYFKTNQSDTYYACFKSEEAKIPISIITKNNGFVFEWHRYGGDWRSLGSSGARVFVEAMDEGLLIKIDMSR